jgi:aspartyl-tRNA(Asn)/glutamyl-tRNA(Gln) amidotransferase subunit C
MKIDQEQLERIETLARLQLTEDEEDRLRDQLSQILEHVEKIGELDLQDVEPLTHPLDLSNVMRADEREDPLNAKEVLRNAPERTGQFFKVPQIIDNENG